jgi:hypothetical protein
MPSLAMLDVTQLVTNCRRDKHLSYTRQGVDLVESLPLAIEAGAG